MDVDPANYNWFIGFIAEGKVLMDRTWGYGQKAALKLKQYRLLSIAHSPVL